MVRDRLPELQGSSGEADPMLPDNQQTAIRIENGSVEQQISEVLQEYSNIRQGIVEIKANVLEMRSLLTEITTSIRNSSTLPDTMNAIRDKNLSICQRMFAKMKELEVNLPWKEDYSTLARVKRINFYCIRDDFLAAWREHEAFLVYYEERLTKSLIRQAKITNTTITEEEAEHLISNKTTSMFVGNILEETEAARSNLRDLLTRHSELEKIERSLTEVRDMFLRISTLIMDQNALIQVVEYHAQQASINLDKGTDQLEKARDHKMKFLKRKSCIIIWVTVVLTIVVLLLLFT